MKHLDEGDVGRLIPLCHNHGVDGREELLPRQPQVVVQEYPPEAVRDGADLADLEDRGVGCVHVVGAHPDDGGVVRERCKDVVHRRQTDGY